MSAPASRRRVSWGTMSRSAASYVSMPAAGRPALFKAAVRPCWFDSPQALLTRIIPGFFAPWVFTA